MSLAADANDCFDLLFVDKAIVNKLGRQAVECLDLHDGHACVHIIIDTNVKKIAEWICGRPYC